MCYGICVECNRTTIGHRAHTSFFRSCECTNGVYEFVCFGCWKKHKGETVRARTHALVAAGDDPSFYLQILKQ